MHNLARYLLTALLISSAAYLGRKVLVNLIDILEDECPVVDEWLDQNDLGEYKKWFKEYGISTLSGCGTPEHLEGLPELPELPPAEERRLRRAAHVLQQRLVLRQWLTTHKLQHLYSKLLSLDVSSIEDVYWLEDSTARHVMETKDFNAWLAARQSLPTDKETLLTLKADLWSTVVKKSRHQDAWTWGGMLVVSISVCGLVTLAAMTQPSLAPEAKHSLLQYVTGKYLHPPSCRVEWGWHEPHAVGETMCFTVLCFQRNGQPYPVSDADELSVLISCGTMKITSVVELGSGDPALAHTVRVKFVVRVAGLYIISVTIGGEGSGGAWGGVSGSPFRRRFVAGAVCARLTRVTRAPALVCAAALPAELPVRARDEHDNPARPPDPKCFSISLRGLGGAEEGELSSAASFSYDAVNQRAVLSLRFPRPGVFRAAVMYEGTLLLDGEFDCIVLTESDLASVQRSLSARMRTSFEARLLDSGAADAGGAASTSGSGSGSGGVSGSGSGGVSGSGRGRRVRCSLAGARLTLSDYVLNLIPKRVASFRLCSSTKLILQPRSPTDVGPAGAFTVDDGAQPPLALWAPQRDLLAAAYTQLLQRYTGGDHCFKDKQEQLYAQLRAAHARRARDKLPLRVRRDDLLRSSLRATRHFTQAHWCRNFDVSFLGEQGVDWGGVRREWFSLLCGQLFDARFGLFAPLHDSPSALVHPNPLRPKHLKLKHYELAGKLVGKCLYESALGGPYRQLVRARFTRSFLAQIIGLRIHYKYFEQDDPELYLTKIKYVLETNLDAEDVGTELYFCDDVYDANGQLLYTQDLVPNGSNIRVRESTKLQYLERLAWWRLAARAAGEVRVFLRGLALLVRPALLAAFDETELELLLCGSGDLGVPDWRQHALLGGAGRQWERLLGWFWAAVQSFTPAERARLLQFATGCSQLPPGGFQELNPRFQITPHPKFGALPTAHTCFNQLCLPDYDSYEALVRALLWAINEGGEGFGLT